MGRSGNENIDQSTALLEGARIATIGEENEELNLAGLQMEEPLTVEDLRFVRDKYRILTANRRQWRVLSDKEQARLVRIAKQILAITKGDPRAANFRGLNQQQLLEEKVRIVGLFHSERVLEHIWEIMAATHQGINYNKAMTYRGREGYQNDQEEYLAAGHEAVPQAIASFDFSRGFQFNTWYAKKVWGKQTNVARGSGFGIAAGSTWDARALKVKRLTKDMEQYGWIELMSLTRGQLEEENLHGDALADRLSELTHIDPAIVASYVYAVENNKNPRIAVIAEQLWAESKAKQKVRDVETARARLYADVEHMMTRNRNGVTSLDKEISTNDGSVLIGDAVADEDVDIVGEVIDRLDNERVRDIVETMDQDDPTTLTKAEQLLVNRLLNLDGDQQISQKQMHDGVWVDSEGNYYSIDEAVVREWGRRYREDSHDVYGGVVRKVNAAELRELREEGLVVFQPGNGDSAELVEATGQPLNQNQIQHMQASAETKLMQRLEGTVEGLQAIAKSAKAIEKSEGMREVIKREIVKRIEEVGGVVEVQVGGNTVSVSAADIAAGKLVVRSDHKNQALSLARHFGIVNPKTGTLASGAIRDWTPIERKPAKRTRQANPSVTKEQVTTTTSRETKPSIVKTPTKTIDPDVAEALREAKRHTDRIAIVASEMITSGKPGVTEQDMKDYYAALGFEEPTKWANAFSNARDVVGSVEGHRGTYAPKKTETLVTVAPSTAKAPSTINPKAIEPAELQKRIQASGVKSGRDALAIVVASAFEAGETSVSKERITELIEKADLGSVGITWAGKVQDLISNAKRSGKELIASSGNGYAPTDLAFQLLKSRS